MARRATNNVNIMMATLTRQIRPKLITISKEKFSHAKKRFLESVYHHPVSQELMAHTPGSQYLSGSSGTLFGFMGFPSDYNPVYELGEVLEKQIQYISRGRTGARSLYSFSVTIPSKNSLGDLTLPWIDTPWPLMIEEGISGLHHYLPIAGKGYSGEGIQVENLTRGEGTQYQPPSEGYLTPLLEKFRKDLRVT